jgi:hypothetical protein
LKFDQLRRFAFSYLDPGYLRFIKGVVEGRVFFRGEFGGSLLVLQDNGNDQQGQENPEDHKVF